MKLYMQTPHESRMCPIDFEVKRSKIMVTMHKLLKNCPRGGISPVWTDPDLVCIVSAIRVGTLLPSRRFNVTLIYTCKYIYSKSIKTQHLYFKYISNIDLSVNFFSLDNCILHIQSKDYSFY